MIIYVLYIVFCFCLKKFQILGNDITSVNEARVLSGTSDSGLDLPALANGVQRSSTTPSPSLATLNNISKPEPEKIKKWREEQKIMLEKKGMSSFMLLRFFYYV